MRALLGTDVLIDFALNRSPHAEIAGEVLDRLERRPGEGWIAWHSVSNFYYLASPRKGKTAVRDFLLDLATFIEIAPTDTASLRRAVGLPMSDFEDALQAAAALACGAERIVTRNIRDYRKSPVPPETPRSFIARLT